MAPNERLGHCRYIVLHTTIICRLDDSPRIIFRKRTNDWDIRADNIDNVIHVLRIYCVCAMCSARYSDSTNTAYECTRCNGNFVNYFLFMKHLMLPSLPPFLCSCCRVQRTLLFICVFSVHLMFGCMYNYALVLVLRCDATHKFTSPLFCSKFLFCFDRRNFGECNFAVGWRRQSVTNVG